MLDLNEIPVAEGTRRTYLNALANLDKWLKGRPVNDENLAGYLSYLYDKGKSPSYAAGAVAAARWRCDCEDKDDPRGKLCRRALKSFRRKAFDRGRGQVTGLPFEAVKKLVTHARGEKTLGACAAGSFLQDEGTDGRGDSIRRWAGVPEPGSVQCMGEGSRSRTKGLLWVRLAMCHGRADSLTQPQGFADA